MIKEYLAQMHCEIWFRRPFLISELVIAREYNNDKRLSHINEY